MQIFVETDRLILREIVPSDREGLFAVDSDPEVNRFLGNNPVQNIEKIDEIIVFIRKQYEDNGIGRWAVIDKETSEFIGWCGLKLIKELTNDHIDFHDIGYRFNRKYWGKGIGTEAAKAVLDYGFNNMKLDAIYGIVDCDHVASRNILQKIGLAYVNSFEYFERPHDWYALNNFEWRIANCQ